MEETKHKSVNPLAVGMAGAVVGAGAAIAVSHMLTDKKALKKAQRNLSTAKDKVSGYMKNMVSDELEKDKKKVVKKLSNKKN